MRGGIMALIVVAPLAGSLRTRIQAKYLEKRDREAAEAGRRAVAEVKR